MIESAVGEMVHKNFKFLVTTLNYRNQSKHSNTLHL